MIYEMRVYRCVPGRLPALLKRFENVTLKIWEKHGIKQAGFWTTLIGDSNQELTYLLAWESLADRESHSMEKPGRGSSASILSSARNMGLTRRKPGLSRGIIFYGYFSVVYFS